MIVALSNSKGGVGKSTIAVHFAVWLAEQGRSVALVDSDVIGSSSFWLQRVDPAIPFVRLPTHDDVIDQLPKLAGQFDYIVADCPAGLWEVTRAILFFADLAVFPCGPSLLDLMAVRDATAVLKQIQQTRGGLPEVVIIPNKIQMQYRAGRELLNVVRKFEMPSGDGLAQRQAYIHAVTQGTVVWRMNGRSAREATAEIQFLFQQLSSYEPKKQNDGGRVSGIATAG